MTRYITRIAALCRTPAVDESLLRRFRMMGLGGDVDGACGWFESSRELERGLQVSESDALDEWFSAQRLGMPTVLAAGG